MDLFNRLTQNVIKHQDQGYAFYFKHKDTEIKKLNGVTKEVDSSPINFDTRFRLASVTKHFIGCGIISLINDHKLSLNTCVKDIYPNLPNYFNNIKVKNLLNHTSGIYDYEDMPHDTYGKQIEDDDIITFLENTEETYFEVGTTYKYSNTAYILLGLIIQKVSGINLGKYMKEHVFDIAGLNDTIVNYEGITQIDNRAYGHLIDNDKLIVRDQYWCSATIGDGGIYSSLNDLNKWIDFLLADNPFTKLLLIPNILPNNVNSEYGLGMRVIDVDGHNIYYHCGDTIGTNTLILYSPYYNLRAVFLTNLGGIDTAHIKNNIIEYLKEGNY